VKEGGGSAMEPRSSRVERIQASNAARPRHHAAGQ
jgi:hypothetical protein